MAKNKRIVEIQAKVVDASGNAVKKLSSQFGQMQKNVRSASNSIRTFRRIYMLMVGSRVLRGMARMLDDFQLLRDRLGALTADEPGENKNFGYFVHIADQVNNSTRNVADTFTRVSLATKTMNFSFANNLAITKALMQTFRIAGTGIQEARGAIVQFGQGLAIGALRGRELRSTLEQNVVYAELLAKRMNVGSGELVKLAQSMGGISREDALGALMDSAGELDIRASKLQQTLSQVWTKFKDRTSASLLALNDAYDLTGKIDKLLRVLTTTITVLSTVLLNFWKEIIGVGLTLYGVFKSLSLIMGAGGVGAALVAIKASLAAFATTTGLVVLGVVAVGASILLVINYFDVLKATVNNAGLAIKKFFANRELERLRKPASFHGTTYPQGDELSPLSADMFPPDGTSMEGFKRIGELEKIMATPFAETGDLETALDKMKLKLGDAFSEVNAIVAEGLIDISSKTNIVFDSAKKALDDFIKDGNITKFEERMTDINKASLIDKVTSGGMSLQAFMKEISEEAYKYTVGSEEFTAADKRMKDSLKDLSPFAKRFGVLDQGTKLLGDYKTSVEELSVALQNKDISADVFFLRLADLQVSSAKKINETLDINKYEGFKNGAKIYFETIQDMGVGIADVTINAFKRLEDTLLNFIETGKFEMGKFVAAIALDLSRLSIQKYITAPLAGAFGLTTQAAQGAVIDGGVKKFAMGGVINSPTMFPMRSGQGLMGEAGPEAIVPLRRTSSGDLGVQATPPRVTVNVNNTMGSDAEVSVQESSDNNGQRVLDVMISRKVTEQFSTGKLDKLMSRRYGLNPRGA